MKKKRNSISFNKFGLKHLVKVKSTNEKKMKQDKLKQSNLCNKNL